MKLTSVFLLTSFLAFLLSTGTTASAQLNSIQFNSDDTLRGTLNKDRSWWNVLHYQITIEPNYLKKEINGSNKIRFASIRKSNSGELQIDLQRPSQKSCPRKNFRARTQSSSSTSLSERR